MASSRIADLTVNEFKELVRESVAQSITGLLGDPDQGLRLREDFAESLQRSLSRSRGRRQNDEPFGCRRPA